MVNIPAVLRLLKGLSQPPNAATKNHSARNHRWGNKMPYDNLFSNYKKAVHDILHRLLYSNRGGRVRQDSQVSFKLKPMDSSKGNGSFKISDGTVSGTGVYNLSSLSQPPNAATENHSAGNHRWGNKMPYHNLLSDRKKAVHDILHRPLYSYRGERVRQDSQISSKLKPMDSSKGNGSFKISDGTVSGTGVYSLSSDQLDVKLKLKININDKQQQQLPQKPQPPQQQQQKQQQQQPQPQKPQKPQQPQQQQQKQQQQQQPQPQKPQQPQQQQQQFKISTTPKPPPSVMTPPKMCLAPCNTTKVPQTANCMAIGKYVYYFLHVLTFCQQEWQSSVIED